MLSPPNQVCSTELKTLHSIKTYRQPLLVIWWQHSKSDMEDTESFDLMIGITQKMFHYTILNIKTGRLKGEQWSTCYSYMSPLVLTEEENWMWCKGHSSEITIRRWRWKYWTRSLLSCSSLVSVLFWPTSCHGWLPCL